MKFLVLILISFGFISAVKAQDKPEEKRQSAPDYFDGSGFDEGAAPSGKPMRVPSSTDLPYTDDEIQQNSPENYKGKSNMPVDMD